MINYLPRPIRRHHMAAIASRPITRLSIVMTATDQDLAAMAQTLEQSGDYRVLRRLPLREHFSTPTELAKVGILFDVETTGLDTASDEVVELGMVKFSYHPRYRRGRP